MRLGAIPKVRAQFKQQRIDAFVSIVNNFKERKKIDFLDAFDLISSLQRIWHDFVEKINENSSGELAKIALAEIFFTLKEYFICLGDLIDCIDIQGQSKLDRDSRFILAVGVEFILTQAYAEFSHKSQPVVEILAAIPGKKRCMVNIGIDENEVDLFDELIKQTEYISGRAMFIAKEASAAAKLMVSICSLGSVLTARFRVIQARVNADKSVDLPGIISSAIRGLSLRQLTYFSGLNSVQDELYRMLVDEGPRLFIQATPAGQVEEQRVIALKKQIARLEKLSSLKMQAVRLADLVKSLSKEIHDRISKARNVQELNQIGALLQFLKFYVCKYSLEVKDIVGDSQKAGSLECHLAEKTIELRRKAEDDANDAMERVSAEYEEIKNAKDEERSARKVFLLARQRNLKRARVVDAIEVEPNLVAIESEPVHNASAVEIFYQELAKSRQSDQEKLDSIDEFCRTHGHELAVDLRAQIFLQISRAELLIKLKSAVDEISLQRDLLLALHAQETVYKSWLEEMIENLARCLVLPEPQLPERSVVGEAVLQKEVYEAEIPAEICVLLAVLSKRSQVGFTGQAYLVGGYLRDSLLKINANDIDLVCIGYGKFLHRNVEFHEELKERLFNALAWDSKEQDQIAIGNNELENLLIVSLRARRYEIWFSEEPTLGLDALSRDLTFNSLYARADKSVFSPLPDAIMHARGRLCVPANPQSFFDDPVRLLRLLDYVVIRGYGFDGVNFKNAFYAKLKELKKLSKQELESYLGEHLGHFAARTKKLLFSAQEELQRVMLCALLSPAFFTWLSPRACQLLAEKSAAYAKIISEKSRQYGPSLEALGVFARAEVLAAGAGAVFCKS